MRITRFSLFLFLALAILITIILSNQFGQTISSLVFSPANSISNERNEVDLGRVLFFDARLSRSTKNNCASCHNLKTNGASNVAIDRDDSGQAMKFNTPTIFNSAHHYRFGWLGKNLSLKDQVRRSLYEGMEGGGDLASSRLAADPAISSRFRAIYDDGPTEEHIIDALSAFVETLFTHDAPFDRWEKGDRSALTNQQLRGYEQFRTLGCANCHQGRNFGANLIERRGLFKPLDTPNPRYIRVPSLRNVTVTAPYFHNGREPSLREAIKKMARAQLDLTLNKAQLDDIVAFLGALEGSYQGRHLRQTIGQK